MSQVDTTTTRKRLRKMSTAWAVILILVVTMFVFARPSMPDRVLLYTGSKQSAYYDFGVRLARDLRDRGLHADVVVTDGAIDNLRMLTGRTQAVALAPATVDWQGQLGDEAAQLAALASVGFEPFWLFHRSDLPIERISDLTQRTLATEGTGTTSHNLAVELIKLNGLTDELEVVPLPGRTSERALDGFAAGKIDAVFVSGQAESTVVASMLHSELATLLSLDRAVAYSKRISGTTVIQAPEGVFDFARNVPARNAQTLGNATCLVAHKSIDRNIVPMLLVSVENVLHDSPSLFSSEHFPSSRHLTLPLEPSARRFFRQGEVGLSKYLPYKIVRILNHLGFFVLPILTVAAVLLKGLPIVLRIIGNMQMKAWFRRLESVEKRHAAGGDQRQLLEDLDSVDRDSAKAFVPRSNVQEYIDFRQFLHDMRERVQRPAA